MRVLDMSDSFIISFSQSSDDSSSKASDIINQRKIILTWTDLLKQLLEKPVSRTPSFSYNWKLISISKVFKLAKHTAPVLNLALWSKLLRAFFDRLEFISTTPVHVQNILNITPLKVTMIIMITSKSKIKQSDYYRNCNFQSLNTSQKLYLGKITLLNCYKLPLM